MRLGGPVFYTGIDPEQYVLAHIEKGYQAGLCPDYLNLESSTVIHAVRAAFERHEILLAEVGAWCNPLSSDPVEARRNIRYMINRLRMADALGARTCVNLVGTTNTSNWYGPSKECYESDFFEEAVRTVRYIIDEAKPVHTKLSLEMMPYSFLDSPEEYLRFLKAVDRDEIGIHLDICNCINSPRRYYQNEQFIEQSFALLGDRILSLHLKDIRMRSDRVTVSFDEVLIGTGNINYRTLMGHIAKLPADTPALLEHLGTEEEYDKAAQAVRTYAKEAGMSV